MVKKFLRSLSKSWEAKVTVLNYTIDLTRFSYDDLIGSLLSLEMMMDDGKTTSQEKKNILLKVDEEGKTNIEKEMNLIARNMRRFYKTFRNYKKGTKTKDKSKKKEEAELCITSVEK